MSTSLRYHAAILALLLSQPWGPAASAQTEWTHHPQNPVLEAELFDQWDGNGLISSTVIRTDGDTLKMWYGGGDEIDVNTGRILSMEIGYAWSLDGLSWTRYDNPTTTQVPFHESDPVLTPEGDAPFATTPRVLADGDTLRMWYAEGDLNVPDFVIRYATSTDGGITWDRHPDPVLEPGPSGTWNATAVSPGDVIKEDGLFKMWYTGGIGPLVPTTGSTRYSIGYATSPDGITWTLYDDPATTGAPFQFSDPVVRHGVSDAEFDRREASSATVRRTADGYELWYYGNQNVPAHAAIGYATSPDGIAWTKYEGNPVLTIEGAPLANELFHPSVLFFGDQYHMWLSLFGNDAPPIFSHIGYATAPVTVAAEPSAGPSEAIALRAPYPNPTAAGASLAYRLSQPAHVALAVYDLLGREVARLVDAAHPAGEHTAAWDGRDGNGRRMGTGVYIVQLRSGDAVQSRKVLLLR